MSQVQTSTHRNLLSQCHASPGSSIVNLKRVRFPSECGSETFSEFVLKTKSIAKIYKSHLIYSYLIKV